MSIASVLEREGNVRDMVEILPQPKTHPWEWADEQTQAVTAHIQVGGDEVNAILFPNLDYKKISTKSSNYEREIKDLNTEKNHFSSIPRFITYLERYADRRYQYKNFTSKSRNSHVLTDARYYVSNIIDLMPSIPNYDHASFLRMAHGIRLNFPSIDITSLLERYITTFGNEVLVDFEKFLKPEVLNEERLSRTLKSMAYLRLLFPQQYKDVDFTKHPVYKAGEEMFSFNHGTYEFLQAAAYMKVLAAEEVRIGNQGIELNMPAHVISDQLSPMPQVRRFDS
jgi:hypothetical protein